jgi:hemolysin activation/secretion protein
MHSFTLGPDYKDFRDTIRLVNGADLTPIHYTVWTASYTAAIQTPATTSSFTLTPSFGIRGLTNQSEQFAFKRYQAKPNFLHWRASLQHERPLVFGTRLFARMSTQLTTEPLISNEQMALGGVDSVRGYLEADVLGDEGASGSIEWRTGSLAPIFGDRWSRSYLFSFFEAGFVRTLEALPSQTARSDLSSWGLGFRIVGLSGLQAAFDWARPRKPTTNTAVGVSRVNFDFSYGF